MPSSALEQYTMNYGQRLQTLLTPQVNKVLDTSSVLGRPSAPTSALSPDAAPAPQPQQGLTPDQLAMQQDEQQQAQPQQSALAPPAQATPAAAGGPGGASAPAGKGTSARKLFENLPDAEQEKQARDLADALKRGGKTVDEAYDELVKQMGTRPDEGLSKKDKSMLLIEFGLNLMAQSAKARHGGDLTGAMGDAGINSLDSYQRASGAKARDWDQRRSALETGRVKDKLDLGLLSSQQEIKSDAMLPHEFAPQKPQISSFAGGDGFMYTLVDGKPQKMQGDDGKPIRAPEKDLHTSSGPSEKVFEFDHRKKAYLQARGYDEKGDPIDKDVPELKGEEKRKMLQRATDYAGDTKNAAQSDEEVMQQAQRAVDEQLRYQADHYRDYSPADLEAERSRLVAERVKEIKAGRTSALDAPRPSSDLGPLASPSRPGSQFEANPVPKTPPASILVEGKVRKIKGFDGRWTLKNGQPVRVD